MIKRVINIDSYWKVIVYFNINYDSFNYIAYSLRKIKCSYNSISRVYYNMINRKAKAVTISNLILHTSVVLFNVHKSYYDYINSIVHEAEHIKQSMLKEYLVEDEGESAAYTVGYIASKMIEKFSL